MLREEIIRIILQAAAEIIITVLKEKEEADS